MKKKLVPIFSLFALLLAGCGGGGGINIPSSNPVNPIPVNPSGYSAGLIGSPIWDSANRTLTFFFSCIPSQNVSIASMEGNFTGPTSGTVQLTYDLTTHNGQGTALLPVDGTYTISIYAIDSTGKKTLVLQFNFNATSSSSGGSSGGSGGDTPPPPPF